MRSVKKHICSTPDDENLSKWTIWLDLLILLNRVPIANIESSIIEQHPMSLIVLKLRTASSFDAISQTGNTRNLRPEFILLPSSWRARFIKSKSRLIRSDERVCFVDEKGRVESIPDLGAEAFSGINQRYESRWFSVIPPWLSMIKRRMPSGLFCTQNLYDCYERNGF